MLNKYSAFKISPQQKRIWWLQESGRLALAQCLLTIAGPLHRESLQKVTRKHITRHEALRTNLICESGMSLPMQVVNEAAEQPWAEIDLSDLAEVEQERRLNSIFTEGLYSPFNIENGPTTQVTFIALSVDRHALMITLPALFGDGQTLRNMVRELSGLYVAQMEGRELPADSMQYVQFSEWQNQLFEESDDDSPKPDWVGERFITLPHVRLPFELSRGQRQDFRTASCRLKIGDSLFDEIVAFAKQYGSSIENFLLAGWYTLMWKMTARSELTIGKVFDGRKYEILSDVAGAFAKVIPLRCGFEEDLRFDEVVQRVDEVVTEAADWQEYFCCAYGVARGVEGLVCPLSFEFIEWPAMQEAAGAVFDLSMQSTFIDRYEIKLNCLHKKGALWLEMEYEEGLYGPDDMRRLLDQYRTLLREAVERPQAPARLLGLLSESERRRLVIDYNSTEKRYERSEPAHQMFERQVELTPERVAVEGSGEHISYAELNRRANGLARRLRRSGVGIEKVVGISLRRRVELVVAMLGVLKSGGAYAPVELSYPAERKRYLLEDSGAQALVTEEGVGSEGLEWSGEVIKADSFGKWLEDEGGENLDVKVSGENLCYVIYTSGSTGRPKGVMVTHGGLENYVRWSREAYGLEGVGGGSAVQSSVGFDLMVTSIYPPLVSGGKVEMLEEGRGLEELAERMKQGAGYGLIKVTPGQLEVMRELGGAVGERGSRVIVVGGEALRKEVVMEWKKDGVRVINEYGPTETVVGCSVYEVEGECEGVGGVAIGRPIANTKLYVLDEELRPVGVGEEGEIYIGGAGLARGYKGKAEATGEAFVPDVLSGREGGRLYRSGDRGRIRGDGNLEYVGRKDKQVKVKGYRVELGEIEAVLATHDLVEDAVVIARANHNDEKRLFAYVVVSRNPAPNSEELRRFALMRLPEYMAPSAFVILDRMPLTANGKVDRVALERMEIKTDTLSGYYQAPATEVEEILAAIYSAVLGVEKVGATDNFFALGGDSIRSVRVAALAKERSLNVSVQKVYQHQTVRELAKAVQKGGSGQTIKVETRPFDLISPADFAKLPEGLEDAYPLASLQMGMLYHMQLTPEAPIYHNVNSFHLRARFVQEAFQEAVQEVVNRHPALRTSFNLLDFSEPLQLVHRQALLQVPVVDLRHLMSDEQDEVINTFVESENRHVLDLSRPPLLRLSVHRRTDETFVLILAEPHAISDGWSTTSTLAEVFNLYFALLNGEAITAVRPLASAYRDFIRLEKEALQSQECRAYWTHTLAGCTRMEVPRWPASRSSKAFHRISAQIPVEVVRELRKLAQSIAVPLKSVLLAAHVKVMSHLSGLSDILTGLVSNGRPEELDGDNVRGLFLNTIPFRLTISRETWIDLIRKTFDTERESLPYRHYPMGALQREWGQGTLFETAFSYLNFHSIESLLMSGQVQFVATGNKDLSRTNYTLESSFTVNPTSPDIIVLMVEYDINELCRDQVESISGFYMTALGIMAREPDSFHNSHCLLSAPERDQILIEHNRLKSFTVPVDSIHHRFETQAERVPDAIAIMFEEGNLTYGQLNQRANQLAHYLQRLGVGPEAIVAIHLDRSIEMIIAILGVLKAGGAYLPLDSVYPKDRLAFMIEDSNATVLLTDVAFGNDFSLPGGHIVCFSRDWGAVAEQPTDNPVGGAGREGLAYVIYTSGSTGKPKGALITHQNVLRLFEATQPWFNFGEDDIWTLFHSPAFDFSVWELWGALFHGGRLVGVPYWLSRTPAAFLDLLSRERVTVLNQTPAAFQQLIKVEVDLSGSPDLSLRLILFGGEALDLQSLKPWFDRHGDQFPRLVNMYGITETTVFVTYRPLMAGEVVRGAGSAIGERIPDLQVYALDQHLQPLPLGVAGELYIGGAGVGRGYLSRPELTATRFIPHPFSQEPGARIYKSGDLARFLPNGEFEYVGRIDNQVKIRGFRIELGEIESVLCDHPAVSASVVLKKENQSDGGRLVAFIVGAESEALAPGELRAFLRDRLPDYMKPSSYTMVDSIPLTINGKVDVNALLSLADSQLSSEASYLQNDYLAPSNSLEKTIVEVWQELLGIDQIGVNDNFFELGGHSLLIIQLVARLRKILAVDIPLRTVFEAPTVAELARRVDLAAGDLRRPQINPIAHDGEAPLSFAQQCLWVLDQLEPGNPAYNLRLAVRLIGALNILALEEALHALIVRHEVLRTKFVNVDDRPIQIVLPSEYFRLPIIDLTELSLTQRAVETRRLLTQEAERPFNLSEGNLLRVTLIRSGEDDHALLYIMHHIIGDAWSMSVILNDVTAIYGARLKGEESPLPKLPIQSGDFARWQREWLQGDVLDRQLSYWKKQLDGAPPILDLPVDRLRPSVQSYRGARKPIILSETLSARLRSLSLEEEATLFMTLLAAFNILLYHYTAQEDIVIGAGIANRDIPEAEELIGFFMNTLPLRTDLSGDPSYRELLQRVRQMCLAAYDHQDLPVELLVEEIETERIARYSPLFQVMFDLRVAPKNKLPELPGVKMSLLGSDNRTSKFDLTLFMQEGAAGISGSLEYNTDLFYERTITRMVKNFQALLESIVEDPDRQIDSIPLVTEEEGRQLVESWSM